MVEVDEDKVREEEEASSPQNLMESRTAQIDDYLNEQLERAFHKQTSQLLLHDVAKIAIEHDPIDLANAARRLPSHARLVVFENLPDIQAQAVFLINTNRNTRATILRKISDSELKEIIEIMPADEAVAVLDDLSDRRLRRILDKLDPKKVFRIKELQKHERHSAGGLMNDEFFAFPMETTIGEVAAKIRDNPGVDLNRTIFVLSDEGELIGAVPARNLIVNPHYLPLKQVMRPVLHTIMADGSRDEVIDLVERYGIPTLPVVNEEGHLLGVIAHEDVLEAMEDAADETIASIAGTAEDVSEHEPLFRRFLWRAPWLVVTLFAGMVTSTAMTHFQERIWFTFLPFFVPMIAGMSGNMGLQCSTVLVRGMATGELSAGTRQEAISRELGLGLLNGSLFGFFCGLLVFILNLFGVQHLGASPIAVGTTVSFGLFSACLSATVLGSLLPFFFARIGIDPAVASGPIVTAFNDVMSTIMFIIVARLLFMVFV